MRLTIIADDACIYIDDISYHGLDLSELDPLIHAVQWYGEYGEIEYKSSFVNGVIEKPANKYITDISNFGWAIDLFNAAKTANEIAVNSFVIGDQPTSFGTQDL